jgi:catechol 2,3-dioxygenase-like lactoylglutathione lyase family enzyme
MAAVLVPELTVSDIGRSLAFYCGVLGFGLRYQRVDEGFAFVDIAGAGLMLDQLGLGRDWVTGALEPPFGRGVNFQFELDDLEPLLQRLAEGRITPFVPVETRTYAVGDRQVTQRQCCVQDPDGYLLRFCESI